MTLASLARRAAAGLAIIAVSSCSTEPKVQVSGVWTGTIETQVLTLTLNEASGVVSGSGTLTNTPSGTRAQTVSGSYVEPTISMTLSSGSAQPINLTGTVSSSTIAGTLNGSGFSSNAITLTRK
jgi:hypothetical protein